MKTGKYFSKLSVYTLMIAAAVLISCEGNQNQKNGLSGIEKKSMDIVGQFMGAMGKGDMKLLTSLMADDMVWHNEGDKNVPWIGKHMGKNAILKNFMPKMGANLKVLKMKPYAMLAKGEKVAIFGSWEGKMVKSGKTVSSSFAILVEVDTGMKKIKRWWFFEDSYAVSQAYKK